MIEFPISFKNAFYGWLNRWPFILRRVRRRLQEKVDQVPRSNVEPRSEAESEVMAAMGWSNSDWQNNVSQAVKDEL